MVRFDDEVIRQLYQATRKKVGIMCREVACGEKRILQTNIRLKLLMEIIMSVTPWISRLVGRDLIVDSSCSHCGLCVKNCPVGNIYEKNRRIRHRFSCSSCMRCVYTCPKAAVHFRLLTFFPLAGGYNIEKILNQPCSGEIRNKTVPPFFNDYIEKDAL